jgi:hypothetical protein
VGRLPDAHAAHKAPAGGGASLLALPGREVLCVFDVRSGIGLRFERTVRRVSWPGQGMDPMKTEMRKRDKAPAGNSSANSGKRRGRAEELAPFRWKPGQSGNPGGRPKSKPITDKLLEVLEDPKQLEALVRVWLKNAQKGSVTHLREILDRVEGRVALPVDVSGHVTHEMTDEEKARAREVLARITAYDAQPLPPASVDAASEEDENARD